MLAEQPTKTEDEQHGEGAHDAADASFHTTHAPEEARDARAERDEQTPAEFEWSCIHRSLRDRMEGPSVQAYLGELPILGDQATPWRTVLSARGDYAEPARRRFLIQRTLKDIETKGGKAAPAMVVLQLLFWAALDTAFWRFLLLLPQHETLGPVVLDAFEAAIERLPHRLQHAAEDGEKDVDLEKELVGLTLYLAEKLIDDVRNEMIAPASDESPREEERGGSEQESQREALQEGRPEERHQSQQANQPQNQQDEPQREATEFLGAGQILAGYFPPGQLARVLDQGHLFRFKVAGTTLNGRSLIRVVRYPILESP